MAIEGRRRTIAALAGLVLAPFSSMAAGPRVEGDPRLFAAWQRDARQYIGELLLHGPRWRLGRVLEVPTRAHGLLTDSAGGVLAVARRPGDWLLRWQPGAEAAQWQWIEDDRRFNGHVESSADGRALWTTETELETVQGLLGVRDPASLEKFDEWPSHGMDPHQMLRLPVAVGPYPAGSLVVANGGIPTLPEAGRVRQRIDEMDSSIVVLDARDGRLLGQWRLADRYLSLRHLAWDAAADRLGVALQAEHPDVGARAAAPVLAVWDGRRLRPATGQPPMSGYGGDIVARPEGGFAVSCPRSDAVALFDADGGWRGSRPFAGAYALARHGAHWWVAGQPYVLDAAQDSTLSASDAGQARALQWDNHWISAVDASATFRGDSPSA